MKIALFHNLGSGGGKRHLFEQVRELRARGHTLDLFVPGEADEAYLPLAPFCGKVRVSGETAAATPETPAATASGAATPSVGRLRRLTHSPLLKPVAEAVWLRRQQSELRRLSAFYAEMATEIDRGGYDVAYIGQCRRMLAPDILRHLTNTPTVFCCNDTPRALVEWPARTEPGYDEQPETPQRRKRLGRWLAPAVLRFDQGEVRRFEANTRAAHRVLANSRYTRECIARLTGVDARVCYPGVDTVFLSPANNQDRKGVLSVGALLPSKRHDFVIEAVGLLPAERRPSVTVIGYESRIEGSGIGAEGARLERLAVERGVTLQIERHVTDESLREAYRRAAVVAFAPYLEPLGLVALEAMACATPVVGVAEGGVRETVIDGETGFLTDRDTVAFAAALNRLLTDSALAMRMGEKGRERVQPAWTWTRSTDTLEALLRRAASKAV